MSDWRKDHWLRFETDAEHADRVENAEREARWYFNQATHEPAERYRDAMAYLAPLRGPFWERKRADALRLWRESTKEAAALFEQTAEEVMRDGEVSEATGDKWDMLIAQAPIVHAEAAE